MKKFLFTMIIFAAVAVAFGTVGVAYAKSPNQVSGVANGWMGGNDSRNAMGVGNALTGEDILHDDMITALSEALNVPITDLEVRLDSGETMAQIALSEGLTFEQFRTLMVDVRNQAIDQADLSGTLTQVQTDWMKLHGAVQIAGGYIGNGMYGMHQAGQGQFLNPDCPINTQSIP
jgi:hypothetical protein